MLRQREPLRVPKEWTGEKRGFVMAVERALDGLYKLFGRLTFSDLDKSLQNRIETIESDKLNKRDPNGIMYGKARGNIAYCKILTITITSTYCNRPIMVEVSRRAGWVNNLQIEFANLDGLDPDLLGFYASTEDEYYICKTATSTWTVYAKFVGSYGEIAVHRISGCGADIDISVTPDMTLASLPAGYVRARLWRDRWMRTIQKSIFSELDDNGNTSLNGITSIPTDPGVYRVTAVIAGLPAGTNGYGPLLVINGGSYLAYYFIDARFDMFYARSASVTAPTKWYKVTHTEVGLTT